MKKVTITVAIPVLNEERNILNLLESIYRQKGSNFSIKEILVLDDGSHDGTKDVVRDFANQHPNISLLADGRRKGKAQRLNELYRIATGDFILSLDGDVVLKNTDTIKNLVEKIEKNVNVVGARFIPVHQKSFFGILSNYSYESFEDAVMKLNRGNNIYSLMGAAQLVRTEFARNIFYPKNTISDQNYLYAKATQNNKNGYVFCKKAEVYMRTVSTLHDWRVLGLRSTTEDKKSVRQTIGEEIMKEYYMPRRLLLGSTIKFFLKNPVYTTGSVAMNLFIRLFPLRKAASKNGKWELTFSSKIGIFM